MEGTEVILRDKNVGMEGTEVTFGRQKYGNGRNRSNI